MHFKRRIKDFVVYAFISLALVGAVLIAAFKGINEHTILNAFGAIVFTGFTFAYFKERSKKLWGKPTFRLVVVAVLIVHISVISFLFSRQVFISGIAWFAISSVELLMLFGIREMFFSRY